MFVVLILLKYYPDAIPYYSYTGYYKDASCVRGFNEKLIKKIYFYLEVLEFALH